MKKYIDAANEIIISGNYDVAVNLMDDVIREEIHLEYLYRGEPMNDIEFLADYMDRHAKKYGEEFTI